MFIIIYYEVLKLMIKNLVISGGGISGMGILGVLKYLEKRGVLKTIENYTGTSVGSLLNLGLALGYDLTELYYLMIYFDYSKLIFEISLDSFIDDWGFAPISKLKYFISRLIQHKGYNKRITLIEFYQLTNKSLNIIGSCVNDGKSYCFNYKTVPNMSIVKAVAISCCIPLVFTPIKYKNKFWVDGGLFNNYPISFHKKDLGNTIGICIYDKCYKSKNNIDNIEKYMMNVFKCIAFGHSHNTSSKYDQNTINFVHEFNSNYGFKMSKNDKNSFFNLGYNCALEQKHKIDNLLSETN